MSRNEAGNGQVPESDDAERERSDGAADGGTAPSTEADRTARAERERLREENERLRARYDDSRRSGQERTALGLAVVGLFAGGFAVVAPAVREPLIGIAAIGVFAGIVTWYLTPEQFIPADVGQSTFEPLSRNEAALVDQLGLSEERLYLETEDGSFRLFVPQTPGSRPPRESTFEHPLVVSEDVAESGVAFEPSGAVLYREHDATRSGVPESVTDVVAQVGESLRENFELLRSVDAEVDAEDGRVTIDVGTPSYGGLDAFDHPVVSTFGVALAAYLDEPVRAEVSELESGLWSVTYRW
ncbi:hypothetical protein NDI76_16080 [Halogeometricum sp. S1BR25-6]|uniref:DUF7982 domain-containing protein n=1 Tax=Halogeometricum salsisoli TaxID=2950536 RepID=A0ABU2GHH3_9EURY|nr:hypothetical protein [Halogeometricum sp. S1BR25-6]MDS0300265.1 hypothetical protein [Halogeometricum sp. S1BR25-6]